MIMVFVLPIWKHNSILQAIEALYLIRTGNPTFAGKNGPEDQNKPEMPEKYRNTIIEKETKKHYKIKVDFAKSAKLFCFMKSGSCRSNPKKDVQGPISDKERLRNLYSKGVKKLQEDVSIYRIV